MQSTKNCLLAQNYLLSLECQTMDNTVLYYTVLYCIIYGQTVLSIDCMQTVRGVARYW